MYTFQMQDWQTFWNDTIIKKAHLSNTDKYSVLLYTGTGYQCCIIAHIYRRVGEMVVMGEVHCELPNKSFPFIFQDN